MNLTFQAAHRRARGNPLATAASADGDRAAPSGTASDRSEPDLLHRYIARLPASRRTPPVKRAVRRGAQRGPAAWDSLSSPLAAAPKGEGELTTRPAEQKLLDAFLVDSGVLAASDATFRLFGLLAAICSEPFQTVTC